MLTSDMNVSSCPLGSVRTRMAAASRGRFVRLANGPLVGDDVFACSESCGCSPRQGHVETCVSDYFTCNLSWQR